MNGYAKETSNLVIAASQKRLAIKAATNPERTKGSRKMEPSRKWILLIDPGGRSPFIVIRHFKINCPYTVKNMHPKI